MTVKRPSSVASARDERVEKLRMLLSDEPGAIRPATEDHVLSIIACRRGREAIFGRDLFCDPAWDVLLELHAAALGRRRMSLSDLARVLDLRPSTMARWIGALAEHGLVLTVGGGGDESAVEVELSPHAAVEMQRLLDYWRSAFGSI